MTSLQFKSREDELRELAAGISEVRATLRDLSLTLTKLERHVARAFPEYSTHRAPRVKPPPVSSPPTLSRQDALALFDRLVATARMSHDRSGSRADLEAMGIADLTMLATELAVPITKKSTRRTLVAGILGRLQEVVMLGRNVTLESPQG